MSGSIPLRASGDLNVAALQCISLQFRRQITLHHLHVIEIHLHLHVAEPNGLADSMRILLRRYEKAGHVARVDRFKKQSEISRRQFLRGILQIGD